MTFDYNREIDSDGEEYQKYEDATDYVGYRMWYALEIDVKPALPEKVMTVVCPCQVGSLLMTC